MSRAAGGLDTELRRKLELGRISLRDADEIRLFAAFLRHKAEAEREPDTVLRAAAVSEAIAVYHDAHDADFDREVAHRHHHRAAVLRARHAATHGGPPCPPRFAPAGSR